MARKSLRGNSFGQQKLAKTAGRRREQENRRKARDYGGSQLANDLLPELTIIMVAVGQLQPSLHRTRKRRAEQIARLSASIARFGFCVPILVRGHEIIDGHARVEAAKALGLETVPAIDIAHLSDEEVRLLRLAVNRIGELGEWDMDRLKLEFRELIDLDVELEDTGFTAPEIDIVNLDDPEEMDPDEDDDVPPPPGDPLTEPGDIWLLDDHRVMCGSALEPGTYEQLVDGGALHAVITDPPYNVPIAGNVSGLGKVRHGEFAMASGEMSPEEFLRFLVQVLAAFQSSLLPGSAVFAFMDWRSIDILYAAGREAGLALFNLVVWYKESGGMGGNYRSAHELMAAFTAGGPLRTNNIHLGKNGRNRTNVWCAPGANRPGSSANEMLQHHATPKPVELIVDAILDVTHRGEVVLDPFLGSGTTLIAAEKTGRRCFGIELEPRFVDVTLARWMRKTGREPVLAATGETLREVVQRRFGDAEAPAGRAHAGELARLEWRK